MTLSKNYMPISEQAANLKAENKALRENRDELLEELKLARAGFKSVLIDVTIQKAEALKDKE